MNVGVDVIAVDAMGHMFEIVAGRDELFIIKNQVLESSDNFSVEELKIKISDVFGTEAVDKGSRYAGNLG